MDNFSRFTCTITQHDASGSYLSDYNVTSDFVPPMSHLVTVLPEEIANGLTISNPQVFFVPFSSQPHFAIMSLSNLHTVPEDINDNRGDKSYTFLAGTLVNTGTERLGKGIGGNAVKPALITIQILKRTTDGSLTLVGDGFATSARGGNLGLSPSFFPQIIPIPPPGESVIFYLPLWQSITIKDGQKGTVDGEIIIVAPDR